MTSEFRTLHTVYEYPVRLSTLYSDSLGVPPQHRLQVQYTSLAAAICHTTSKDYSVYIVLKWYIVFRSDSASKHPTCVCV